MKRASLFSLLLLKVIYFPRFEVEGWQALPPHTSSLGLLASHYPFVPASATSSPIGRQSSGITGAINKPVPPAGWKGDPARPAHAPSLVEGGTPSSDSREKNSDTFHLFFLWKTGLNWEKRENWVKPIINEKNKVFFNVRLKSIYKL